jgi:hypothetical protein
LYRNRANHMLRRKPTELPLMTDTISKPLMLIGMAGEFHIRLIYGAHIDDHKPIILTVTPDYVAHKTPRGHCARAVQPALLKRISQGSLID